MPSGERVGKVHVVVTSGVNEGLVLVGGTLEEPVELAGLVQPLDLVGAANKAAADEELRE